MLRCRIPTATLLLSSLLLTDAFQIPKLPFQQDKPTQIKSSSLLVDKVENLVDVLDKNHAIQEFVDVLQAKEDACLPNCEHGWFTSVYKNAKLHYRRFLPPNGQATKGIVVFMHGITSFSGVAYELDEGRKINMALLSQRLTAQGYAVYAFDMYGHGYSEGIRHYVRDWKHNLRDYQHFVELVTQQHQHASEDKQKPPLPLFLCGESYGGCLTMHLAQYYQDHPEDAPPGFDSIVLLAPAVVNEMPALPVYLTLRYGLAPLFPRWIPFFMPQPISMNRIWRDHQVRQLHDQEIAERTSLGGGGKPFRLGTAVSLLKALKAVREQTIPRLTVPFAVVHGAQDNAIPIEGTDYLLEHAQTPVQERAVLRLESAYHDLLADPDAEATVSFLLSWIQRRLDKQEAKQIEEGLDSWWKDWRQLQESTLGAWD